MTDCLDCIFLIISFGGGKGGCRSCFTKSKMAKSHFTQNKTNIKGVKLLIRVELAQSDDQSRQQPCTGLEIYHM